MMTESNIPTGFRIIPSHPEFAISEGGEVLNIATGRRLIPFHGRAVFHDSDVDRVTPVTTRVEDLIAEAFPEEVPMFATTTDSHTTAGVRPMLYNHGKGDHISSPSCSTCYLGFEATPEELRQILWQMALDFSEEVDATAGELLEQIHETVTERNAEWARKMTDGTA